jgi:hypothetical protein
VHGTHRQLLCPDDVHFLFENIETVKINTGILSVVSKKADPGIALSVVSMRADRGISAAGAKGKSLPRGQNVRQICNIKKDSW